MTQLARIEQPRLPSVYDQIADPLAFVTQIGQVFWKAGACGCDTEAKGQLLALVCLTERKNPFEIDRTYHLIDGKLSMRADAMLAEFRARGGKHKWIKDGSDGTEAVLELTFDGQSITSPFTIEDAKRAKLLKEDKPNSNWMKDPASMLRARCISRGVRMVAPEIVAGTYTPEEVEEFDDAPAAKPQPAKRTTAPKTKPAEDVIDVQVSPVAASASTTQAQTQAAAAEHPPFVPTEEKGTATTETKVAATQPARDVTAVLLDIEFTIKEIGMTKEQLEKKLGAANPEFKTIDDLPMEKAEALLLNVRKMAEKAKASKGN